MKLSEVPPLEFYARKRQHVLSRLFPYFCYVLSRLFPYFCKFVKVWKFSIAQWLMLNNRGKCLMYALAALQTSLKQTYIMFMHFLNEMQKHKQLLSWPWVLSNRRFNMTFLFCQFLTYTVGTSDDVIGFRDNKPCTLLDATCWICQVQSSSINCFTKMSQLTSQQAK